MSLVTQANTHSILCKIGVGENVVTRVDKAAPGPHDDTACVRIVTESGIILWYGRILYIAMSRSFIDSTSRNSHPRSGGARQHGATFN